MESRIIEDHKFAEITCLNNSHQVSLMPRPVYHEPKAEEATEIDEVEQQ